MAPALLKQVVAERLQSAEDDDVDATRSVSEVRQGPLANVVVDRKAHGGGLSMCHRGLHLESRGEFVTARSKSGFLRGCWVYEATMHTGGHAHVGFVTSHCIHHLSDLNGVGDTALSVAFDGHDSSAANDLQSKPMIVRVIFGDRIKAGSHTTFHFVSRMNFVSGQRTKSFIAFFDISINDTTTVLHHHC